MYTQIGLAMEEDTPTTSVYSSFESMVAASTEQDERGWLTPEHEGSKIRERSAPPPPPKKKRWTWGFGGVGKKPAPKQGYFNPPDLDLIFKAAPPRRTRQAACA